MMEEQQPEVAMSKDRLNRPYDLNNSTGWTRPINHSRDLQNGRGSQRPYDLGGRRREDTTKSTEHKPSHTSGYGIR